MSKKKKKVWLIVVIILVVVVVLAAVLIPLLTNKTANAMSEYLTVKGDLTKYVSASGNVKAFQTQSVVSRSNAKIDSVNYQEGDYVKKGQTIVVIGTEYYKAPIDGIVSAINVNEEETIAQGTLLFSVSDYSSLHVTMYINESMLSLVNVGMKADVTFTALANKAYSGEVTKIGYDGISNAGVTVFEVVVTLDKDNADFDLIRQNMTGEVKIIAKEVKNAILVPVKSVQYGEDGKPFLFVKENKEYAIKNVTLGLSDGVTVEVISGLAENEIVAYQEKAGSYFPFGMMPGASMMGGGN